MTELLLLRHAARGPLPEGLPGGDVPLLPEGVLASRALGERLRGRLATLHTSPVRRCVQTAEALREGAAWPGEPVPDPLLGAPGAFVEDAAVAWRHWLERGHEGVMAALVAGERLPGLADPPVAARRLFAHLVDIAGGRPGVHVFVTHDALLAPTIAHLLRRPLPPAEWPTFLEALALAPRGEAWIATWRGHQAEVP